MSQAITSISIATRESPLALWQANHVKDLIEQKFPAVKCEIQGMTTEGDRNKSSPLVQIGGKGVFVKELETALIDGTAEIAVHSMKDVPAQLPDGLGINAICKRADPRDAFVSNNASSLADLADGAVVGSSSSRRCLQIARRFPHLTFKDLRGNVGTRLARLDAGEYDAVILAVAGLERLGKADRITDRIIPEICLPAAGQGAVGIESRNADSEVNRILQAISDEPTSLCVTCERMVTQALGASCTLPIASFAEIEGNEITLSAFVSNADGSRIVEASSRGSLGEAMALAQALGRTLIEQGALALIGSQDH